MDEKSMLILWGEVDLESPDEDALNDWWTNEHLLERLRLPGFERARRYCSLEPTNGNREYLAWYEVSSSQDLASDEYLHALNNPTSKTKQFMPCLSTMNRSVCRTSWKQQLSPGLIDSRHPVYEYLVVLVSHSEKSHHLKHALSHLLEEYVQNSSLMLPRMVQVHIAIEDSAITNAETASKSYDGVRFIRQSGRDGEHVAHKMIALLEVQLLKPLSATLEQNWAGHIVNRVETTGLRVEHSNTYKLIFSMDRSDVGEG
jgi:hypothetical protein